MTMNFIEQADWWHKQDVLHTRLGNNFQAAIARRKWQEMVHSETWPYVEKDADPTWGLRMRSVGALRTILQFSYEDGGTYAGYTTEQITNEINRRLARELGTE